MKRDFVFHPFFFTAFPVLSLLANNIQEVLAKDAIRSLIVSLSGCMIILLIAHRFTRNWQRAAIITSLGVIGFFSYGHVYTYLKTVTVGGEVIGRHRYLLVLFGGMLACAVYLITRLNASLTRVGRFLNFTSAFLMIFPVLTLLNFARVNSSSANWIVDDLEPQGSGASEGSQSHLPDIYYIILDAYARSDVMRQYGFDNRDFLEALESQGFYIAEASNANHNWTALSLASSLNMAFVQDLGLNLIPDSYPGIFNHAIQRSRVRTRLERLGYSTVSFQSGYVPTEIVDADFIYGFDESFLAGDKTQIRLNAFEGLLIYSSMGRAIIDLLGENLLPEFGFRTQYPFTVLRGIILSAFEKLPEVAEIEAPTFTFVHIVAPHNPYLFGPNGEEIQQTGPWTFVEDDQNLDAAERSSRYRDQAIYISQRIRETVQEILDRSRSRPMIILQADHGPGVVGHWNHPKGSDLWQRTAILNAYLLPEQCGDQLYPSITPVNTFRLIFNCQFGEELELLPDNVYFSYWPGEVHYSFTLVNENVR